MPVDSASVPLGSFVADGTTSDASKMAKEHAEASGSPSQAADRCASAVVRLLQGLGLVAAEVVVELERVALDEV